MDLRRPKEVDGIFFGVREWPECPRKCSLEEIPAEEEILAAGRKPWAAGEEALGGRGGGHWAAGGEAGWPRGGLLEKPNPPPGGFRGGGPR